MSSGSGAGAAERVVACDGPAATYSIGDQIADTGGAVMALDIGIAQVSALVGAGATATASFAFA